MAVAKKKIPLYAFHHRPPDWARIRTTVQVGKITVQVGTHAVIISRPRYPNKDEVARNDGTESILETITVRFNEDDTSNIRCSLAAFHKGATPKEPAGDY